LDAKSIASAQILAQHTLILIRTARKERSMTYEQSFGPALIIQHTGQVFPLTQEAVTIGRQADNRLVLADPKVSSHHAIIFWRCCPDGRYGHGGEA
jgi:hypothetical protein